MSRVCAFDALNRLSSLASVAHGPASNVPVTAYSYSYEPKRSLITSIHNAISGARQTNLYDAAGQLIGVDNTRYTYDAAGRLTGATTTNAALSAQDQHSSLTYGPGNTIASLGVASNIASVTLDVACASPLALTNWLVAANGVPACSNIWRETQTDFIISNVPLGGQQLFVRVRLDGRAPVMHDTAGWSHWGTHQPATNNQLHFAVEPAAIGDADRVPVNAYATHTYTYDPAGQLLWRQSQVSSFQDQVSYRYDAARNLTACWGNGFTNSYAYDHARRLIREIRVISGQASSNAFVYDGMDLIAKLDEVTGEIVYFTRGLGIAPGVGDVLAETHILGASTQSFFYITNHRGDTVALVDEAGDVVGSYEYDAYGNVVSHTGQDAYFTFSSKHYDEHAGLYYYGFRWYDPVSKRWTQPDPEGLSEGLHLYQFCGNDPVNNVDVYGMSLWSIVSRLASYCEDELQIYWAFAKVLLGWQSEQSTVDQANLLKNCADNQFALMGEDAKRLENYVEISWVDDAVWTAFYRTPFAEYFRGRAGRYLPSGERYIYTEVGWIDLQHVVSSASMGPLGPVVGLGPELDQYVRGHHDSAFAREDFHSNTLGALAALHSVVSRSRLDRTVRLIIDELHPRERTRARVEILRKPSRFNP